MLQKIVSIVVPRAEKRCKMSQITFIFCERVFLAALGSSEASEILERLLICGKTYSSSIQWIKKKHCRLLFLIETFIFENTYRLSTS